MTSLMISVGFASLSLSKISKQTFQSILQNIEKQKQTRVKGIAWDLLHVYAQDESSIWRPTHG